jgi:hypothetical protein
MLGRRGGDDDKVFAFNAESWPSCIDTVVQLTEVFRQKDERFVVCVSRVVCVCVCHTCVVCRVVCRVCRVCRACCVLTRVFTQHIRFQAILNGIRQGTCSDDAASTLNECGAPAQLHPPFLRVLTLCVRVCVCVCVCVR